MNITLFNKPSEEKITLVTCYDYPSAQIVEASKIPAVLVGDSVAMTVHGYPTTVFATLEMLCMHTAAVARGMQSKFIVADLPFLSYRKSQQDTVLSAQQLMQSGAHAVKLEGADAMNLESVRHLVNSGVPVMGHIGLTPQGVHALGGFRVQGKKAQEAEDLINQARALESAGCFAVVLECIPGDLAGQISESVSIATIGIGAGPNTDGQILVWHDLLGLTHFEKTPKFIKTYLSGKIDCQNALNAFHEEVCSGYYPGLAHTYK